MKMRVNLRLTIPAILLALALASTASGQWVEDSIDVGGIWVGSMAHNPTADVVYGASESGVFFVIDCASNSLLTNWNLPRSQSVTYDSIDDKVYCTTYSSDYDTVYVIDGTTFQPVVRIPLYWALEAVWDPDRNRVYVSCGDDNEVAVIDCATDSVIATVHVGRYPIKMSLNRRYGRLYVLNYDGESVSIVDLETLDEVEQVDLDGVPYCGYYSESAGKYYAGGMREVVVIDGADDTVVAEIPMPHMATPYSMAENPERGLLLVAATWINDGYLCPVSTADDSVVREIAGPDCAYCAVWSAHSRQFYVVAGGGNRVGVVNSDGSAVVAEVSVRNAPFCMAMSPRQHRLYIGHLNNRMVYVLRDQSIGIEEPDDREAVSDRLRVWPSPFRAVLNVHGETGRPYLVYAASGRLVKELKEVAGVPGQFRWDGRDDAERDVPPGVYVIAAAGDRESVKVVKTEGR